jgi:hypothetical protein
MAGLKDHVPFLAYGGKIDPLSEIRNAGIVTNGSVFWTKAVADPDYTTFLEQVGGANVRNTAQASIDQTRDDVNDYVIVCPQTANAVYVLGTAIDVNKDRVHFISAGYTRAGQGYSSTFRGYVAADGIDTELMMVTGAGVELAGFRLLGTAGTAAGGTLSNGFLSIGTAASGTAHQTWVHDVAVENTQAAAAGGTTVLVKISGDVATGIIGPRFDDCWIGDFSWAPTYCVDMATGTAGPTRATFTNVTFVMDAQAVGDAFVNVGTGVTQYGIFKDCRFINVEAGTANTSAIVGPTLVDNPILMDGCRYVNVTQAGTDTEVYKSPASSGTQAAVADFGIGVGTAAISPV